MSADNKRNTQELVSLNRPASATWRVMVVDDERDNLEVITRLLQFLGSTVITAENGVEALKKLQTEKPTFILSDLLMPEMDGWKLFQSIRKDATTARIPIIAVTASTMTVDARSAMAYGFDGFIAKPFSISTFITEIQRCLDSVKQSAV
ncbi:MAG: response regulator [Aggregatilineales bacterium]